MLASSRGADIPGMLALSTGGKHCSYMFGFLEQLFIDEPTCYWKDLAGNSAGALICAGISQTNNNSEYIHMVQSLYTTMCSTDIAQPWNSFGSILNGIHAFLFHDSLYKDSLTSLVSNRLDPLKMRASGKQLHIGVYNKTRGLYETISGVDNMLDAICASASIPGVFPPRTINGDLYVDGGIGHVIPVPAIIKWCDEHSNGQLDIMVCYPITSFKE